MAAQRLILVKNNLVMGFHDYHRSQTALFNPLITEYYGTYLLLL